MERDGIDNEYECMSIYFNSHAHVERDGKKYAAFIDFFVISTHTLTWSVTLPQTTDDLRVLFQLTRSRGA